MALQMGLMFPRRRRPFTCDHCPNDATRAGGQAIVDILMSYWLVINNNEFGFMGTSPRRIVGDILFSSVRRHDWFDRPRTWIPAWSNEYFIITFVVLHFTTRFHYGHYTKGQSTQASGTSNFRVTYSSRRLLQLQGKLLDYECHNVGTLWFLWRP